MAKRKKKKGFIDQHPFLTLMFFPAIIAGYMVYGMFLVLAFVLKLLFEFVESLLKSSNTKSSGNRNKTKTLLLQPSFGNNDSSGLDYERYVANKLWAMGYTRVEVTKGSGDFGADILANKNGFRYCIQCKKYSNPVGIKAVQEIYAAKEYYRCDYAMVVTTSVFTDAAKELASKTNVLLMERFN